MRLIDADKLLEGEHFILKCKSEFGITEMDIFRREVIENAPTIYDLSEHIENAPKIDDLSSYSDKLWKLAYERGKSEAIPRGEWIPVSDRLPKIDTENGWKASDVVLVCLADEKIHMGFYCEDKKWQFCESGEEKEPFWKDVIAWQPLPEPYKEAEND